MLALVLFLAAACVARAEGDGSDQSDSVAGDPADQPSTVEGQLGLAAVIICCTGVILGYSAGKDLLVVLWG